MPRLPIEKIGTLLRKGFQRSSDRILGTSVGKKALGRITKFEEGRLQKSIESLVKNVSEKGHTYGFNVKGRGKYLFYPHPKYGSIRGLFKHVKDKEPRSISDVRGDLRFLLKGKTKKRLLKSDREIREWLYK